jgi:hypothetical protein
MTTKIQGLEITSKTSFDTRYTYKGVAIRKTIATGRKGRVARTSSHAGSVYAFNNSSNNRVVVSTLAKAVAQIDLMIAGA